MTHYDLFDTPLGVILLVGDGRSLTGAYFDGQKYHPPVGAGWVRSAGALAEAGDCLRRYFAGEPIADPCPLDPAGTPFQRRVWSLLRRVRNGETVTYADLAAEAGDRKAARAVGAAVGKNPISVLIPCHRVVGTSGKLTGYAGGLDRKTWLLGHEAGRRVPGQSPGSGV